jgi:Uncharacterized protein conserved in bacteria (DUF2171)
MADPVSWFMIEPGWKVVDAEGESVGSVDEIIGDSSQDIFNGLAVSTTFLGKPRYVAAEEVAGITEGTIRLKLPKEQVERLGEYEEPPTTAEILPDDAGLLTRAEAAVEAPTHRREQSMNVWRRLWLGLRRLFG